MGGVLLSGIRILDFADESGSFCSRLLADLGASVIKVEQPEGDRARNKGHSRKCPDNVRDSLSFVCNNSNKLGITLDIERKEERELFLSLVQGTDVLVETFQPGYLEKLGMGFDNLKHKNPRLILVSITGFGQTGPRRNYRSCDLVSSAFGGQMYVTGAPAAPPIQLCGNQTFYAASLSGATAVLLAIRKRNLTGRGTHIDLSIQEAVVSTLDHVMVRYFDSKIVSTRLGNHYWNDVFHIFPCKDGHMQMTILYQWETLLEWMVSDDMAGDLTGESWKDEKYRIEHVDHIIKIMEQWTLSHRTYELFEKGQTLQFPWAPIFSPEDVLTSPQLEARQFFMWEKMKKSDHVPCRFGMPYRFSRWHQTKWTPAPLPGEHNKQVYEGGQGMIENKLDELSKREDDLREAMSRVPSALRNRQDGLECQILSGIRILDFTRMLAGPYATRMFADFGADVIKVQSGRTATGAEQNSTAYFKAWNRNKRSITLNMDHPEARDIILKLTALSDIVVENFSPRVLPNWGLSYEQLKEAKPDIIMASISATGQIGPWRNFVGFGPTFHALSGLSYLSSLDKKAPSGPGHAYADTIIGLYTALGMLAALEHRDKTGEGQYIDISGYEATCTLLEPFLLAAGIAGSFEGVSRTMCGIENAEFSGICCRCLGKDRWCVISLSGEEDWRLFCHAAGLEDMIGDPRFLSAEKREHNKQTLNARIEEWTSNQSPERVVSILQDAGIAAGVVQSAEDLSNDQQLKARDFFVEIVHPVLGTTVSEKYPFRFNGGIDFSWKAAPLLGADNDYVFCQLLGFTDSEVRRGRAEGLFR